MYQNLTLFVLIEISTYHVSVKIKGECRLHLLGGIQNYEIPPLHIDSGYCDIKCKNTVRKIKEQFFNVCGWDPVCHQVLSGNYQLGIGITPCYFPPVQAV